jgi:hypothetical protein
MDLKASSCVKAALSVSQVQSPSRKTEHRAHPGLFTRQNERDAKSG